jgi:hypothetical protein
MARANARKEFAEPSTGTSIAGIRIFLSEFGFYEWIGGKLPNLPLLRLGKPHTGPNRPTGRRAAMIRQPVDSAQSRLSHAVIPGRAMPLSTGHGIGINCGKRGGIASDAARF